MKRLAFGAAVGGAALALLSLAPKIREMHAHCREMMRARCDSANAGCQPESSSYAEAHLKTAN